MPEQYYTTHHYHVAITLAADEIAPSPDEVQEALFGMYTDADGIGVEWALKVPRQAEYGDQDIVQGHGEDAQ